MLVSLLCVCLCVSLLGGNGGGAPLRYGHKEIYKDLNLKNLTSEWDSKTQPHEYQSDALNF